MADNNGDDVENSDLEINEIGEVSGELFGNNDSNEEFNDYEMDSTDESDHETDIDTIDDTKWRNNNNLQKNIECLLASLEYRKNCQPTLHTWIILLYSCQIIILK